MDILEIVRHTIETLPEGPHLPGLRSVLRHIEAAYKHFERAQKESDETAFTDSIYRTNQAFEGSIKEAYRVIEHKDPQRLRPSDIEDYFEKNKVFRGRVLAQFTNYRKEWRNPSTHDHNLDFDEDEAFLAIVSVSAFTKLLIDQIAEELSFAAAQKDIESQKTAIVPARKDEPLIDRIIRLFREFGSHYATKKTGVPMETEAQLMGALAGFLSSVAPDLQFTTGRIIRGERSYNIDMEVSRGNERLIIELKRGQHRALVAQGVNQLTHYVLAAKAKVGLLFLFSENATEYIAKRAESTPDDISIYILRPNTVS